MPVLIPANRRDPTGTHTLRENYRRHLQRPLNQLITDIRRGVIERDVFGLRVSPDTLADDDIPPSVRLDRDSRKVDLFYAWLRDRLDSGLLETVSRENNTFIRSAYVRGLKDAGRMVRAMGGEPNALEIEAAFDIGVHRQALERLFISNYSDLEDISQAMANQIREELTEGFALGEGPRTIARRITDRVDKIGKTRAETLARTRVIDAHSEATLNRYERMGVSGVTPRAEFATAGDSRVCPICESIEGTEYSLGEVRDDTFDFEPGEDEDASPGTYPVRPPVHPRCRCVLLPVIT